MKIEIDDDTIETVNSLLHDHYRKILSPTPSITPKTKKKITKFINYLIDETTANDFFYTTFNEFMEMNDDSAD